MGKLFFHLKTNIIVLLTFILGVFLILFLSWKVNPDVKELYFIPDWIANWADEMRNSRRRTAIPFIGLGILEGVYILYIKRNTLLSWVLAWILIVFLVGIAEVGQFFLPSRSPDLLDVFWGGLGGALGLFLPFWLWNLFRIFKKELFGKKRR